MTDQITRRAALRVTAGSLAGAGGLAAGGAALANQPRMEQALGHLHEARIDLEAATADKGGHRKQALDLIDEAIRQVRIGISVGAL